MSDKGKYTFYSTQNSQGAIQPLGLPDNTRPRREGGGAAVEIARAVDSEAWETFGDELEEATFYDLLIDIIAVDEADASQQATYLYTFGRGAYRIERDERVYKELQGKNGRASVVRWELQPSASPDCWLLTLTLAPLHRGWKYKLDNTFRLF